VRDIVHAAASVSFSLPLDESRAINVEGTRRMLELAELCRDHGGLQRFCHVSTAYVAGEHEGEFAEDDLEVGQEFRNAYEQSKFEAERLVRAHRRRLPIQIFRPSIVVGERPTGWTASFNVLYAPLKAFSRGEYVALPGSPTAPVDVVSVDYVADAIFELANGPAPDRDVETYHLVAGRCATTVGRLIELSAGYFRRRPPPLLPPGLYRRLVHPLLLRASRGRTRQALERSEVLFPYFAMRVRYGDERARRRLEPRGIRVTPVERYFHRLADFAVRARWGRAAPTRAEAARRARTCWTGASADRGDAPGVPRLRGRRDQRAGRARGRRRSAITARIVAALQGRRHRSRRRHPCGARHRRGPADRHPSVACPRRARLRSARAAPGRGGLPGGRRSRAARDRP
jgi:long-chain acyl-CoA synthetase